MRVYVDETLCAANGLCIQAAPDVFSMDDDDDIVQAPLEIDERHRSEVELAVALCPVRALRLEA
jgi:ferredoxin